MQYSGKKHLFVIAEDNTPVVTRSAECTCVGSTLFCTKFRFRCTIVVRLKNTRVELENVLLSLCSVKISINDRLIKKLTSLKANPALLTHKQADLTKNNFNLKKIQLLEFYTLYMYIYIYIGDDRITIRQTYYR